ncbi:MAG: hypothetical protein ABIP63_05960 [Thermoanaerobaculia bacterium]
MKKLDSATIATIEGAIRAIEKESSAEVVVDVRWCSGSYAHADHRFAAMVAFAALLFVLFAPPIFAPWLVPFAVGLSYAAALVLSRSSDSIRRLLTTRRERLANTRMAAAAAFVEYGVAKTRQGSGVLVLFSRLERRIEIIGDRGVLDAVPVLEWNQMMASSGRVAAGFEELAATLEQLQPLLTRCLPVGADDVNELLDGVRVGME